MQSGKQLGAAIKKVIDGGDVKPLARLLRATTGEFEGLHYAIAELLDPQQKRFNFILKLKRKKGRPTSRLSAAKQLQIALAMANELQSHHRKKAVGNVAKDYEVGEKTVSDCHTYFARKLPDIFGSVRPVRRKRT